MTTLAELLKQPEVKLNEGDYLASITRSEGYVPTYKDTSSVGKGRYLYKIVGTEGGINLVPVITSEDGKEFIDDLENPIVIQNGDKVYYLSGRNHPNYKDGYNGRQHHVVEGIAAGEEHRNVVSAFITFVRSEFSMGVNDFMVADPELVKAIQEGNTEGNTEG